MINNPKLINKIISQIKSLTSEEIAEVIRKVDMEEDIKILEEIYTRPEINSNSGTIIKVREKSIKNVVNRLQENEAVIKEMSKSIVNNNDIEYEVCENVHELSIECDGYSRETKEHCEKCIENYFRKKVKDERNKV